LACRIAKIERSLTEIEYLIMLEIAAPKLRPVQPAPPDHYCRLFTPVDPPFSPEVMTFLGRSMAGCESKIPPLLRFESPPAGYTYFGQFIDHDITRDDTYLFCVSPSLRDLVNGGGARLDLNHLYGDGPTSDRDGPLYDGPFFRLGDVQLPNGSPFDLALDRTTNKPLTADDRTPENVILRQLCVMFMMLHNLAVQELPDCLETFDRFEKARVRVQWQYQWLVREDYLSQICDVDIFKDVVNKGITLIDWETDGFAIPVEFSQAAFRFGHSMVRPFYMLRDNTVPISLKDLFSGPDTRGALDPEMAVDWQKFLQMGRPAVENAMNIDTTLAQPLFCLPPEHIQHRRTSNPLPLPPELSVRTLRRGAATGLPTGEMVAEKLGRKIPLRYQNLLEGMEDPWLFLDQLGLSGRTPLWYYLLLEAELDQRGAKLGTIGSRLVAEVIDGALRADSTSYLVNTEPDWTPPPWRTPTGRELSVERLKDVPIVVGLTRDAP
jgi:hypothetical protein